MAADTHMTVVGNLTADPELRYAGQTPVTNFTIASTPRTFNRQTNDWVDGETLFIRVNVWREQAENAAHSLTKGTRVVATGILKSRTFDDREGNSRTQLELEVEEIGPSLRYASAAVVKQGQQRGVRQGPPQQRPQQEPTESWGVPAGSEAWSDDTPF